MKIRTDFVTNSSSSSFIISQKGKLTDAQKEALLKVIERQFLGHDVLKPGASEKEIDEFLKDHYISEGDDEYEMVLDALKEGKDVRGGYVVFYEPDSTIQEIYEDIWEALSTDPEVFELINGELDY